MTKTKSEKRFRTVEDWQQPCYLVLIGLLLAIGSTATAQDLVAKKKEKPAAVTPAFLIKVPLPIVGDVDEQIKRAVTRLSDALSQDVGPDAERPVLVLEFGIEKGQTGKGSDYGRSISLAEFITGDDFRGVRTIAYLPTDVFGHAVLPVLACDQIIMGADAELGKAGIDVKTVNPRMRSAYSGLAKFRRLVDETVVQGMLDPQLEVFRITTIKDEVRYVLAEEHEKLAQEGSLQSANTITEPGQMISLKGSELRDKYKFVTHLVQNRRELAEVLNVSPESLEENPLLGKEPNAVLIDLSGPIDNRTIEWVLKSLDTETRSGDVNLVILKINSGGGDPALSTSLASQLAGINAGKIRTVAYVPENARGDAALIAVACDHLILGPNAILGGPGDSKFLPKDQESVRNAVKLLGKRKSRDWSILAALFDPKLRVSSYTKPGSLETRYFSEEELQAQPHHERWQLGNAIEVAGGVSGRQAMTLQLARETASDWDEVKKLYHIEQEPRPLKPNWTSSTISEFAEKFNTSGLMGTLLFIAFFALMAELSSPGVGVPGFISAVCFALFFWIQFLSGNAFWLEILLFLIGITFLVVEIFVIPGFGIFGIGGALMVVVSIILASQTFILPSLDSEAEMGQLVHSLSMVLVAGAGVGAALLFMRQLLTKVPFFRRLTLAPPEGRQLKDQQQREAIVDWSHLMGQYGITTTRLSPSGKARFDGEAMDVISDGALIPKGTQVKVVEVSGSHVRVVEVK